MFKLVLKFAIIGSVLLQIASGGHWSYTSPESEPNKWPELYKAMCSGTWQSPINLLYANSITLPSRKIINIYGKNTATPGSTDCTVVNNGHSIQVDFPEDQWFVSFDNGVQWEYSVIQLHFHWGKNSSLGSEHRIESKAYPLESHLVTYRKSMYPNASVALQSSGGLAVLGFLHTVSSTVAQSQTQLGMLGSMRNIIKQNMNINTKYNIGPVDLPRLLDNMDRGSYFRYMGSLTTPPCTENVMWTVFDSLVPVTEDDLNLFRSQKFPNTEAQTYMYDNYRPIQPLNSPKSTLWRQVYRSSAVKLLSTHLTVLSIVLSIAGLTAI